MGSRARGEKGMPFKEGGEIGWRSSREVKEEVGICDNPFHDPPPSLPLGVCPWVGCFDAHSWAVKLSATLWIDRSVQLLWSCNKQEWKRKSKSMTAQMAYVVHQNRVS